MRKIILIVLGILFFITGYAQISDLDNWKINGNSNSRNSSFIGTKGNYSLRLKTNNTDRLKIDSVGNTSFYGAVTTSTNLTVGGNLRVAGSSTLGAVTYTGAITTPTIYGSSLPSGTLNIFSTSSATPGIVNFDGNRLTQGALTYTDSNIFTSSQGSVNNYYQSIWQNSNNGNQASVDLVVSNDLGSKTNYYGNFGMNSSTFTGTAVFSKPNAVYLTAQDGDLAIGTTSANAIFIGANSPSISAISVATNNAVSILNSSVSIGGSSANTQTIATVRINGGNNSFMDFGNIGTNSMAFWMNRNGSKLTTNYNLFADNTDMLLNDSSSVQIRLNNASAFAVTNPLLSGTNSDFSTIYPISFQKTTLQESRCFRILARNQGFGAGGTLATQRQFLSEAVTYSASSSATLTDVYNSWFSKSIAGANVTISRNWGIGTDGSAHITQSVVIGSSAKAPVSALDVTGTMSVSSTATISGQTVHGAPVRIGSTSAPSATLDVTGTMSVSSTATITGAAKLTNTLNYVGNTTLNSNATATLTTGNTGTVAVLSDAVFPVYMGSASSTANASTTYYFGNTMFLLTSGSAVVGNQRLPYNCTLVGWDANFTVNGTPSSAGSATLSINGTTNYTMSTAITCSVVGGINQFTANGLSQNFNAGDLVNIKLVTPAWATAPTQMYSGVTLWFVRRQ